MTATYSPTNVSSLSPMSSDESLILVARERAVGIVRLNRPKALNALSNALMKELIAALEVSSLISESE